MNKRLTKSADKRICGACGGIAEYLEIDPSIVRIGYAALTLFTTIFPGVILYLIMWVVMPDDENRHY